MLVTRSGLDCIELSPFVRQILGAKRTPTSVRHVYDESRTPSRLLLRCLGRHCFNRRGAVAVAFRHPLRIAIAEVLVVHPPNGSSLPTFTPCLPSPHTPQPLSPSVVPRTESQLRSFGHPLLLAGQPSSVTPATHRRCTRKRLRHSF